MITMHVRLRQTDRRTNIMAIARRFVLTTHRALESRDQRRPLRDEAVDKPHQKQPTVHSADYFCFQHNGTPRQLTLEQLHRVSQTALNVQRSPRKTRCLQTRSRLAVTFYTTKSRKQFLWRFSMKLQRKRCFVYTTAAC